MSYLKKPVGLAIGAFSMAFVLFLSVAKSSETRGDSNIISYLRQEPTTLFDAGMKRLRRSAMEAARRMSAPADQPVKSRVWYKPDSRTIEVRFTTTTPSKSVDEQSCWDARARIIREVLQIGTTAYRSDITYSERIRRRIGLMFAHESSAQADEIFSESGDISKIGKELSRILNFEIEYVTKQNSLMVTCRDPVLKVNLK